MANIYTFTFSPTIDKSTQVDRVVPEHKLRCSDPVYDAGGGGINVSRAIKKLGENSTAVFPCGGAAGEQLKELLNKENILQKPIKVVSNTRENFIVVETHSNRQFRFGMPSPGLSVDELEQFFEIIENTKNSIDILVVSGSIPDNVPSNFHFRLSEIAEKRKIKLVLDTSGNALKEALKTNVYLCKPNVKELSNLVGKELFDIHDQEEAAMQIIKTFKVEILVVSQGASGAIAASKEGITYVAAPSVKTISTVGAGDCMLAGLLLALSKGWDIPDALRYGIAAGTAATMNPGTTLCKQEDVQRLYEWLKTH